MKSEYSIPAIFCSVLISVLLSGCVSGKKAFEQGNYVQAVLSAVERLREIGRAHV